MRYVLIMVLLAAGCSDCGSSETGTTVAPAAESPEKAAAPGTAQKVADNAPSVDDPKAAAVPPGPCTPKGNPDPATLKNRRDAQVKRRVAGLW